MGRLRYDRAVANGSLVPTLWWTTRAIETQNCWWPVFWSSPPAAWLLRYRSWSTASNRAALRWGTHGGGRSLRQLIDQARHMAWKHVKLPRTQSTCSDTWSFGAQGGELSLNPACFLLSIILDTPDFYGSYTVWYKTIWSSYLRKKRS